MSFFSHSYNFNFKKKWRRVGEQINALPFKLHPIFKSNFKFIYLLILFLTWTIYQYY